MLRTQHKSLLCCTLFIWLLSGCDPDIDLESPDDEFQSGGALAIGTGEMFDMMDEAALDMMGEPNTCRDASQCPSSLAACFVLPGSSIGECVECTDSTYCPNDTRFCLADNRCGSTSDGTCRVGDGDDFENGDCLDIGAPYCLQVTDDGLGVCVECVTDDQCIGAQGICATAVGRCVASEEENQCQDDMDCGLIRRCNDTQICVPL